MNQESFRARHESEWAEFACLLDALEGRRRKVERPPPAAGEATVAHRYRVLCQQLALARERQYSAALVERLNGLVLRGHHALYGARPDAGPALGRFLAADFALTVRTRWRPIALAAALFFLPLLLTVAAVLRDPDFVHLLLPQKQIAAYEQMYDPTNQQPGRRAAESDSVMFGHYIWNNVRIGFQTFAGGLLFGLGSVFFLASNGMLIGAVAGHLLQIGFGTPFLSFVAGHSAFELSGIVLMGAAGLMLGGALVLPGAATRISALRERARAAVPLVIGGGVLLVLAALVEAFWSPLGTVSPALKYATGCTLWLLLLAYFAVAGRTRAA